MGERRGHPVAVAVAIVVVTLAGVFFGAVFWMFAYSMVEGDSGRPMPVGETAVWWLILAGVLVGGLWCAWLVGSGRVLPHRRVWWPTHQVPAGGMKAWGQRDTSGESIDLPERLPLRLDEVIGVWARVSGSNGASNWVEAGLLVPRPTPFPEPAVPGAGGQEGGAVMDERQGHPVVAVLVGLFTLAMVGFGAVTTLREVTVPEDPDEAAAVSKTIPFMVILLFVLVGGLWLAWRVGTGHWGLRRRPKPAMPFRFFAVGSAQVLASDTRQPIGHLEKDGEYTAVGFFGGEVLVEDASGRRGWVPDSVVPARVRRSQKRADAGAGREGGR